MGDPSTAEAQFNDLTSWPAILTLISLAIVALLLLWSLIEWVNWLWRLSWPRGRPPFAVDISIGDVLLWSTKAKEDAADQLRCLYDWQIDQWATFGKAVLTATLAFLSAGVIAAFKGELDAKTQSPLMPRLVVPVPPRLLAEFVQSVELLLVVLVHLLA